MTAPNWFGYSENENKIALRAEKRKAQELAQEFLSAVEFTEAEQELYHFHLRTCNDAPSHVGYGVLPVTLNTARVLRMMDEDWADEQATRESVRPL